MNAAPARFFVMDGMRGIAVLGILLMNIAAFAMPEAAYSNPLAQPDPNPADLWTWAVLFVLADGKMRGLFTLLFGAGMAILHDRAEAAGRDGQGDHVRRMGWLFIIGLAHHFLIWDGDILSLYATAGLCAWLFAGLDAAALARRAALFLLLSVVMTVTLVGGLGLPDALSAAAIEQEYGVPDPPAMAAEIERMRGSYGMIALARLREAGLLPFWQILLGGPEALGLMLLGMAGARSGLLSGIWPRTRYLRFAAIGYAIGLPLSVMLAAAIWKAGFSAQAVAHFGIGAAAVARLPMLLGHAALALWWLTGPRGAIRRALATAGRMALSNYLLSSLMMAWLFHGYGLGWFGMLGRFDLLGIVAGGWAVLVAFSLAWMRVFSSGPAEWLWRSLSARRILPIKAIATKSHYN